MTAGLQNVRDAMMVVRNEKYAARNKTNINGPASLIATYSVTANIGRNHVRLVKMAPEYHSMASQYVDINQFCLVAVLDQLIASAVSI